jgi:hypothetical protein
MKEKLEYLLGQSLHRTLILLSILLFISSCGLLGNQTNTPPASSTTQQQSNTSGDPKTTKVAVESLAEKKGSTLSDIEVLWQIPNQAVEGFVINYGFDQSKLDQHAKIATKDLEKYEDQKHGFVFRYIIGDVPLNKTVYVSISAFNGEKISRPSEVFPVNAEVLSK